MTPVAFSLVVVGVSWLGTDPRPWWVLQQFWAWVTERDTQPYEGRHRQ